MRIDSSYIGMESARSQTSVTAVAVNTATQGSVQIQQGNFGNFGNLLTGWTDRAGLSEMNEDTMSGLRYSRSDTYSVKGLSDMSNAQKLHRIREECVMYLFQLLFSNRKHGGTTEDGYVYGAQKSVMTSDDAQGQNEKSSNTNEVFLSLAGFAANVRYFHAEAENTTFTTKGKVVTGDGREIDFGLELQMSRSFAEYYEANYEAPQPELCDPLVINLEPGMAKLSDQKFLFDLDQDGVLDRISSLEKGSGFLALDKNGDGKINDGTELFGTASGNGFADLAAYDEDGNGFIDEGDEIFDKLKIWIMDENGNEQLVSLKEKGVGAICLQNMSTDFSLTGQDNQTRGMIRNTGFFLYESGAAGSIQHVDVAKYSQAV